MLSILTICSFNPFRTSYWDVIFSSSFSSLLFFSTFSCFKLSIFSELLETSSLILSISFPKFRMSSFVFSFSIFKFSISAVLFSILLFAFSISCSILAIISSIDVPLSSNDDTDIFRSVMSVFKLSMYVWSSWLSFANSAIFWLSSAFSLSRFSITWVVSSFADIISCFSFSICSNLSFNFAVFSSNLLIWELYISNSCFLVAKSISISWRFFSNLADSSIMSATFSEYSSFSFVTSSIFLFSFSRFFLSSSISLPLPNILTVFWDVEPPLIAPDGFITSPSRVTILNE